jgi:hypothetical protein
MNALGEDTDMHICPQCKTLTGDKNGNLEWQVPEKVTLEEIAAMEKEEILSTHAPGEFRKATSDRGFGRALSQLSALPIRE